VAGDAAHDPRRRIWETARARSAERSSRGSANC
jgi:hypothetical protein